MSWSAARPLTARPTPSPQGQTGTGCNLSDERAIRQTTECRLPATWAPHYKRSDPKDRLAVCLVLRAVVFFRNDGRSGMEFVDRLLTCADCGGEFIFTAGEQLFFLDKQFKNDPKRCKPCKSRRSAAAAGVAPGSGPAAAGISRTETRTECSECGISTTVPFKPTQGRPVLCRQCFKNKRTPVAATSTVSIPAGISAATVMMAPADQTPGAADITVAAQAAPA